MVKKLMVIGLEKIIEVVYSTMVKADNEDEPVVEEIEDDEDE